MTIAKLRWGRDIPDTAIRAWGARAVFTYDDQRAEVDLLPDRQDYVTAEGHDEHGDEDARFCSWLDMLARDRGLARWCEREHLRPNESRVLSATDAGYHIEMCPNASLGYLYICAYELAREAVP